MESKRGMLRAMVSLIVGLGLVFLLGGPLGAQAEDTLGLEAPEKLIVATKEAAPFSFKTDDGRWRGISIELWMGIAQDLGLDFEFQETPLKDLIGGLQDERFDASVAALTVTSEREQVVDFTHPFHPSGLGIAVPNDESRGILSALNRVLSVRFFQAVGTLLIVLFLGGMVLWLLERKKNAEQFGGSTAKGLGAAVWWSAVTMTTVGYGDKAPTTTAGRGVAVIWMFASVIMISGLTATIASTLTVSQLEHTVRGPEDLPTLGRLACVRGSTGEVYLRERRLAYQSYGSAAEAMQALVDKEARAAVYDAPILNYLALTQFDGQVSVLPVTFERQDYAFALPLNSPLRKAVNKALLERVSSEEWADLLYKYMGVNQ